MATSLPHRQASATFNLSTSTDSSDTEDDTPLPFPTALPRVDFLAPNFDPAAYLSALPHRHQTLEDLRSDLRDRSATISGELLELVNSNYTTFLSLGSELNGGEEKVQDVKVALMGFRRAVDEVKKKVATRRTQTEELTTELRVVRSDIEQGRRMLEAAERLSSLEQRLTLDSLPKGTNDFGLESEDDEDEDEDEEDEEASATFMASSPKKLAAWAAEYRRITLLVRLLDQGQTFVQKLEARLIKCRNTLLLDLNNAIKESRKVDAKGQDRVLKYLAVYRTIDAQAEAIKALKSK